MSIQDHLMKFSVKHITLYTSGRTVEPRCKWCCSWVVAGLKKPEPHVHIITNSKIPRILLDTRSGLADPRIVDKLNLGSRCYKTLSFLSS
jgi:hypothetical protein